VFSEQYGRLVTLEKKIQELQSTRERFISMLQEVSRELVDEQELGVALTPQSIELAIGRHEREIETLQERRQAALNALLDTATKVQEGGEPARAGKDVVEGLGRDLAALRMQQEQNLTAFQSTEERLDELRAQRELVAEELGRMTRAMEAGGLLADLKITNCPACDRPIARRSTKEQHCYLCKRPETEGVREAAEKRLAFELQQLRAELAEIDELLAVVAQDAERLTTERASIGERITRLEWSLKPARAVAAAVLPVELTHYDQETGRLRERVAQLRRILATLDKRQSIAGEIEKIQEEVGQLDAEITRQQKDVSFEHAGDLLSDGMNTYLNLLKGLKPNSWTQKEVDFVVRDRSFSIRIGGSNWRSKLGGTLSLYCLIAYHFALLSLTNNPEGHYPGLAILDFPPELDGVSLSDSENFVLEPFVKLLSGMNGNAGQLIAAGSAFEGLRNAHRIELARVWV